MYDLGLLEGVVGVTLLEFVVFDTEDSGVEGILGADGEISEGGSRIIEVFSTGILKITCYKFYFIYSTFGQPE